MVVRFPGGVRNIVFSQVLRPCVEPTIRPLRLESGSLWPGVKRSERETDYSHPFSAKVKKDLSCSSTLPYVFAYLHFFPYVYCRHVYELSRTKLGRQSESCRKISQGRLPIMTSTNLPCSSRIYYIRACVNRTVNGASVTVAWRGCWCAILLS